MQEKISQVCRIANTSEQQAILILIKNNWEIESSILNFIENPSQYRLSDIENINLMAQNDYQIQDFQNIQNSILMNES
jgi:hypothetical protein